MVPLDELAVVGAGDPAPQRKEAFSDGGVPFVRVQDMGKLTAKTLTKTRDRVDPDWSPGLTLFPQGTVLITKSGASTLLNQRAILGQDSYVVSHIATVAPSDVTSSEWLYYFLKTVDAGRLAHGGNMPSLPLSRIKKIAVPLAPAYEQRRIVEKIETLFAELDKGEESLRQVQALLARHRQSVLKAAVTGELTADWRAQRAGQLEHGRDLLARILKARRENWQGRGKYKEPVEPDTRNLPELPEGWVWASVDQLLCGELSNGRSVPDAEDGFPVLRLSAIKGDYIDLTERKTGAWEADDARPFVVAKGDILVSRGNGSKKLVGRGGFVGEDDAVAYPDTMIRIRVAQEFVSSQWFLRVWNSHFMRVQIEGAARTTAGIYKISQKDILGFYLPLPPRKEQDEIAGKLDELLGAATDVAVVLQRERFRSLSLRQSILREAFSGKLVPQDPSDEPASELLARIRAQRAAQPGKATRRKTAA